MGCVGFLNAASQAQASVVEEIGDIPSWYASPVCLSISSPVGLLQRFNVYTVYQGECGIGLLLCKAVQGMNMPDNLTF